MAIEDLFAGESYLHRAAGDHREFGDDDFVIEGITLPAETSAVWRSDHPNVTGGHLEHFGERAMHVVWRLCRAPQRQLFVGVKVGDCRVLLEWQVGVAFVKENVFSNEIGFGKSFFDIAEFQRDFFVNVSTVTVLVDARLIRRQSIVDGRN